MLSQRRGRWFPSICLPALAGIALVAVLGCSGEDKPEVRDSGPGVPVDATKRTASNGEGGGAQPDNTLSAEEYIRAGLPADDRLWSGADMTRAAQALSRIARNAPDQLPRYQSGRSGALFARITADENLDLFRNRSLPLEQRMPDALAYLQSSNAIGKLYVAALGRRAVGGSELAELTGSLLRISVVMLQLIGEFLPTLDRDDPSYAVRMEGLATMKKGLATVVAGALQTLTERHVYEAPELKRLLGYMQETLPVILPELPPGSRMEAVARLRAFRDDVKMADLRPELVGVLRAIEKSDRKPSAPIQ